MTFTDFILNKFGKDFFRDRAIYDVGCHDFQETKKFLDLGADVVGIDRCVYADIPRGINFVKKDFLNWKPEGQVDILHMANVALFIDSDKVMNKIVDLNPRLVMVRTMYDYPNPNWPPEVLKKLYFTNSKDWSTFFEFKGYRTIYEKSYEQLEKDLQGIERTFRFTDYIGEKYE